MFCYAVFTKHDNKQIRVFSYSPLRDGDYKRAEKLARDLARNNHANGYPCTVERFAACSVGILDYDTDKKN